MRMSFPPPSMATRRPASAEHNAFMGNPLLDVEQAQQRVVEAVERGEVMAEAVALTMLSQALFEDGQEAEARRTNLQAGQITSEASDRQVVQSARHEALMDRGDELAEAAGPAPLIRLEASTYPSFHTRYHLLTCASRAYQFAGATLAGRGRNKAARDAAFGRAHDLLRVRDQTSDNPIRHVAGVVTVQDVAAGFLALKAAGPFLEAFATKLGDQLGESTARTLGHIRLRSRHRLEAKVSEHKKPLVLILPEDFNDEVRLSIIELEALPEGGTMRWNPDRHTWEEDPR